MVIIESLLQILVAGILASCTGLGFSLIFFRHQLRDFRLTLAPVLGFLWIISGVPVLSAAFPIRFHIALMLIIGVGVSITVWNLFFVYKKNVGTGNFGRKLIKQIENFPKLGIFVSLAMYASSALVQGFTNFWGTANPDFLQSWSFLDRLVNSNLNFYQNAQPSNHENLFSSFFPDELQARFGGVSFSGALNLLGFSNSKMSLVLTIVISEIVLILVGSVFYRTFLKSKAHSYLATLLLATGAPIAMSFIFMFIGQNSTLFLFPLVILLTYLYLKRDGGQRVILFLGSYILIASFFIYIPIAPLLIFLFYVPLLIWLFRNKHVWRKALGEIFLSSLILVGFFLVTFKVTKVILQGYLKLISIIDTGDKNVLYFSEWHSRSALAYFSGTSTSPLSNSSLILFLHHSFFSIFFGLVIILFSLFGAIRYFLLFRWDVVQPIVGLLLFLILSIYYATILKYGYAEFKLSSWFYFLIPFSLMATLQTKNQKTVNPRHKFTATIVIVVFSILNVWNSIDYGLKARGIDKLHGTIVNSYGLANSSKSFNQIQSFLKSKGKVKEISLGLPFVEAAILSGYLMPFSEKISLATHQVFPLEDEYLLDKDGKYTDLNGLRRTPDDSLSVSHFSEFTILPGKRNPNQDVIAQSLNTSPVLRTDFYDVYRTSDLNGVFLTGRGLSREEFLDQSSSSSISRLRWMYSGFELDSFFNKKPLNPVSIKMKITLNPRIRDTQILKVYQNRKILKSFSVLSNAIIEIHNIHPTAGSNEFIFRWEQPFCNFDPANNPKIRWCNFATVSDIQINPREAYTELRNVRLKSDEFLSTLRNVSGFRQDGWLMDGARFAFDINRSVGGCSLQLARDGSNPSLKIMPLVTLKIGSRSQSENLVFGNNLIKIKTGHLDTHVDFTLNYPKGSVNLKNGGVDIPKGYVRVLQVVCQ